VRRFDWLSISSRSGEGGYWRVCVAAARPSFDARRIALGCARGPDGERGEALDGGGARLVSPKASLLAAGEEPGAREGKLRALQGNAAAPRGRFCWKSASSGSEGQSSAERKIAKNVAAASGPGG